MTDTTAPRCPSCGAAMVTIDVHRYGCKKCGYLFMGEPYRGEILPMIDGRVPCPACNGTRVLPNPIIIGEDGDHRLLREYIDWKDYWDISVNFDVQCPVCHDDGTVSAALAAAWLADGDEEAK